MSTRGCSPTSVPMSTSCAAPPSWRTCDGLVIPGGESSVIDKLSRAFGMQEPVREAIAAGMPVYGTCAGLILLADRITDGIEGQETFGGLDVDGAAQRVRQPGRLVRDRPRRAACSGAARARRLHPRAARGRAVGQGVETRRQPRRRPRRRGAAGHAARHVVPPGGDRRARGSTSCSSTPCVPPDTTGVPG